jgi:SAM-dependent methyltransferase
MATAARYIPALGYRWLTAAYDPIVRWATREQTFKAALVELIDRAHVERILDLGCGTGTLAILLAERFPDATIVGVDGDPDVLERAVRKRAAGHENLRFDLSRVDRLPYQDNEFDVVASSLVFHHLDRATKQVSLSESLRVLKPGGRLCLADWGKPPNALMRAAFLPVQLLDGFETTRDNVAGDIPRLIAAAGFSDPEEVARFSTPSGSLAIWCSEKPDS